MIIRKQQKSSKPVGGGLQVKIFLIFILLFQLIAGMFLFVPKPQEAKADGEDWYSSSWLYRKPITIDNTSGTSTLTNYQVQVDVTYDSHMQSDFDDIRLTDSDGATLLDYWLEVSTSSVSAAFWVEVPSIAAASTKSIYMYYGNSSVGPYDYFRISVDSTAHNDYGLAYPITYMFSIPSGSSGLKAYKKYSTSSSWTQITEKTSGDFFNGIDAVRFDYSNNEAYISVAFDDSSDEIHLKITDASGIVVNADYGYIAEYYDGRDMAITTTWDDWSDNETCADHSCFSGGSDSQFVKLANILNANHIGYTVGVITSDWSYGGKSADGPPNWEHIQSAIDNSDGYIEIASHSRHHPGAVPYGDYDDELNGSKQDLVTNLSLPYSKGTSEYVYTYITPNYLVDNGMYQEAGEDKYLVIRGGYPEGGQYSWTDWSATYGLWTRTGYTTKSDCDNSCNCPNPLFDDLTDINNAFDLAYANHGIYHWHGHPGSKVGVSWQGFDDPNSIFNQHVNYIAGKTYAWYAGIGYLYLYHYAREGSVISVDKIGGNDPDNVFELFDNFDAQQHGQNPYKWTATETGTTDVDVDNTIYYGSSGKSAKFYDNSASSVTISKSFNDLTSLTVEFKSRIENIERFTFSLYQDGISFAPVYVRFENDGNIRYLDTSYRTLQSYATSTWYKFKFTNFNFTAKTYDIYIDDVLKKSGAAFRSAGNTATLVNKLVFDSYQAADMYAYVDDVIVRKYTFPELTTSFGSEQGYPIAPTITTPTILSSSAIRWNFTDNSSYETGFKLYDSNGALIKTVATPNLSYIEETGFSPGTTYSRYIKAYNSYGESASSATRSAQTGGASILLRPPASPSSTSDNPLGGFRMAINEDATSTDQREVALKFYATSEIKQVAISENPAFSGSVFQTFQSTLPWTLSLGTGLKTIYAILANQYGAKTHIIRDTITLIPEQTQTQTEQSQTETSTTSDATSDTNQNQTTGTNGATEPSLPTITLTKPISQMTSQEIQFKINELTQAITQLTSLLSQIQPTASLISEIPSDFEFLNNLKVNMSLIDIKYLQTLLNQNPDTQVAQQGAGSPNNETTFFGPRTTQAVIKFQEKYQDSILAPWDLVYGTGIVGTTTRAKLNALLGE